MRRAAAPSLAFLLLTGCRNAAPPKNVSAGHWFDEAASASGISFVHDPHLQGKYYLTEIMGSGAALFDADNDGDLDALLIQGHAASGANAFYENRLNQEGKLLFVDRTAGSGLGLAATGMGVVAGDFDNDGFADLYFTNYGSNALLRNNGNLTFTNVTVAMGVDDPRWSTAAAWLDYDRDGDLDLYVANYVDFTERTNKDCFTSSSEADYCSPSVYEPLTHRLFRNDGRRFTDVSSASGILKIPAPGLGAATGDFNRDGWLDIYIANDGKPNVLWINQRNGAFADQALFNGAAFSEDGIAKAGMGIAAGDFDNDLDEDVFIANLTREGGTLYRNGGDGVFADLSSRSGLRQSTFMYTGFGLRWVDFDHDGLQDLFIVNGAVTKLEEQRGQIYPFRQRKLLLRNLGGDGRFDNLTPQAGPSFTLSEVGRGAAFGDVDNDGAVDVLVNNNHGPARLYLNRAARGPSLTVDTRGALGAEIILHVQGRPRFLRRVSTDGSYLSSSDPRVHLTWPAGLEPDRLEVRWPSGESSFHPLPRGDRFLVLSRPN